MVRKAPLARWGVAWTGGANGPIHSQGALFRLDTDGQIHRVLTGLTSPNGMSWSIDKKTMYLADTAEKTIFAYDFDEETGNIQNKKTFFTTDGDGGPDGHAQDEHGNLWVALWGQWKVVRISPQGQVTWEIRVPTRCPSVRISIPLKPGETVSNSWQGGGFRRRGRVHHQRGGARA